MRGVDDRVAMATIRWLEPGRRVEAGSIMRATAVFVLGGDDEVVPDWPARGHQMSVLVTFTEVRPAVDEADAKIDFLNLEEASEHLREAAEFLVMAGPTPIGRATIEEVF